MIRELLPVILLMFIAGAYMITVTACSPQHDLDKDVKKAYELRMQGNVDEALALVDSILAVDSTNALAYLEKYRILGYMMTGGAEVSIEDMVNTIDRAVSYDPGNVDFAYNKALASFLHAYITMKYTNEDASGAVDAICMDFERVLELKPEHPQAILYLVEIYSQLPPEMGGDPEKAGFYAEMLERIDPFYAAKAKLMVEPKDDELAYWLEFKDTHESSAALLKEIGTACFYAEDPAKAEKYFTEAMQLDPAYNVLLLDMARYYMFLVMQDMAKPDSALPVSAGYINRYLESEPAPVVPLEAYAIGMLVKIKMFNGLQEEGKALMEKAKALDPYFSRAFTVPGPDTFDPPDKLVPRYSSFFRPF